MTTTRPPAWALRLFDEARVAHLATVSTAGRPTVVPVCLARLDDTAYLPIDGKPKTTQRLRRVRDIEADPRVTLLVDRWSEDWSRLAWVQARGTAAVVPAGDAAAALAALRAKYPQYEEVSLGDTVIAIAIEAWSWWRFAAPDRR